MEAQESANRELKEGGGAGRSTRGNRGDGGQAQQEYSTSRDGKERGGQSQGDVGRQWGRHRGGRQGRGDVGRGDVGRERKPKESNRTKGMQRGNRLVDGSAARCGCLEPCGRNCLGNRRWATRRGISISTGAKRHVTGPKKHQWWRHKRQRFAS